MHNNKKIRTFGKTIYEISQNGEVFNLTRGNTKVKGQLQRRCNGYLFYRLGYKSVMAHRLVYETFIGKIPLDYEVMHRNGDRFDNRVENLVCGTHEDNMKIYSKHKQQGSCDALRYLHMKIKKQFLDKNYSKEVLAIEYGYPTDVIVAISRSSFN